MLAFFDISCSLNVALMAGIPRSVVIKAGIKSRGHTIEDKKRKRYH
jgi:hypothetical protein